MKEERIKCQCPCHKHPGLKHVGPCCDNGWITPPSYGEKEEQKRTISSVCRAWTKRDIVQLTIKDMENFEASKLSSGDTNIEEKKPKWAVAKMFNEEVLTYDGVLKLSITWEEIADMLNELEELKYATTRPVQEKPDSELQREIDALRKIIKDDKRIHESEIKDIEREIERLKEIKGIAMQLVNDLDGTKMAVLAKMTHRQLQSALQSYHITSGKTT